MTGLLWRTCTGAAVVILGMAAYINLGPIAEQRCAEGSPTPLPEGAGLTWDTSWWPPGSRCSYQFPDGTTQLSTLPIPISVVVTLLVLGALIVLAISAITTRKRATR